ncbi:hypothetical protein T4B_7933 [Trichinella pseudospiralis]|uniref:Uncharacterized protein n=1 Tax=Trichinella pseudospiralis TaxID=6337 RepID=A0A0V1IT71_TRIPS|nr:hypothetical protein T4B_7933 [Trichinella pseudospiralis]
MSSAINIEPPSWVFYPVAEKFIDFGLLKIYIPLSGELFLVIMMELVYKALDFLSKMEKGILYLPVADSIECKKYPAGAD